MGAIVKFDRDQLTALRSRKTAMDNLNIKLQASRERQLFHTLKEATVTRAMLLKKIEGWINLLENRIFNQQNIDEMPLSKVMALFKYVGGLSLKMMGQMNDVEKIFKAYLETNLVMSGVQEMAPGKGIGEEKEKLKKALLNSLADVLSPTQSRIDEAVVVKSVTVPVEPTSASGGVVLQTGVSASDGPSETSNVDEITKVVSASDKDALKTLIAEIPGLEPVDPFKGLEDLDIVHEDIPGEPEKES